MRDQRLTKEVDPDREAARQRVNDFMVDCFIRGIAVLESPETGGKGPPRGASLEHRRVWRR